MAEIQVSIILCTSYGMALIASNKSERHIEQQENWYKNHNEENIDNNSETNNEKSNTTQYIK